MMSGQTETMRSREFETRGEKRVKRDEEMIGYYGCGYVVPSRVTSVGWRPGCSYPRPPKSLELVCGACERRHLVKPAWRRRYGSVPEVELG
jgi:hypothetical protein